MVWIWLHLKYWVRIRFNVIIIAFTCSYILPHTVQVLTLNMICASFSGEVNPLLEKSYMDLTLHQRVWVLKCICDNSLVRPGITESIK